MDLDILIALIMLALSFGYIVVSVIKVALSIREPFCKKGILPSSQSANKG
jgi:hypothetical protein